MTSYHLLTDLAAQRRNTLVAEAEARSLARQAASSPRRTEGAGARRSVRRWVAVWLRSDAIDDVV